MTTPTSGAGVRIHSTADVSPGAQIGAGTRVWHQAQVREGAVIGRDWILGRGVYVDFGVIIRDNAKIQNYTLIYHGATLEDGLTMGPHPCLINDRIPRAVTPDGLPKTDADWTVGDIRVRQGATVGAGAIILCDVCVGGGESE